jgi:DeoR/GlpR family transcriptional regulator of sugar metabolism
MLAAIKTALLEASGVKEKPLGKNAQNAALRRQFVMDHFAGHSLIRNADLCEGLGVSSATANRFLRELSEDGTLERVRDGKFWAYRLAVNENH